MKVVHNVGDGSLEVPDVNIKNVNVGGAKFLQTVLEAEVQGLVVIALVVHLHGDILGVSFVVEAILWRDTLVR